mmetsp:Transcript_41052/g.123961  ORF Transcript_41052/g.123961 Transcript_41052/m.123961 type:complete len:185 (-) Transcript_41052:61-615(-)
MAASLGQGVASSGEYGATEATAPPVQEAMAGALPPRSPSDTPRPLDEPAAAQKYYGEWAFSTFGCCVDPMNCCFFTFCFPCALVLRVASIVEKVGTMHAPIFGAIDSSNACLYGSLAFLFAWLGCFPYVLFVYVIYKGLRARFAIREGDATSFCKVCCLSCCTWIQVGRHVDAYSQALVGPASV